MTDNNQFDLSYLIWRVHQTLRAMCRAMFGLALDVNDPFVEAYTDLLDWQNRAIHNAATYIEGWLLWQDALMQLDVERALYGGGAGRAVA